MKQVVKVRDRFLTRTEIEVAYAELNAPDPTVNPGDIVRVNDFASIDPMKRFIVMAKKPISVGYTFITDGTRKKLIPTRALSVVFPSVSPC